MRYLILILSLLLTACSKPAPLTSEEQVISQYFSNFAIAGAYDKICNKPPVIKMDPKIPSNINWIGNMQVVAARFGEQIHKRSPDASVEKVTDRMLDVSKGISDKAEKALIQEGCQSEKGKAAGKLFEAYTKTPPWVVYGAIDKQIVGAGGTVSPPSTDKVIHKKE